MVSSFCRDAFHEFRWHFCAMQLDGLKKKNVLIISNEVRNRLDRFTGDRILNSDQHPNV